MSIPRCDLVYFREAFHDAIELGHQYSVSVVGGNTLPGPSNAPPQTMVQPFGYHALVHARCEIGRPTCGRVLLVPCGVHHGRSGDPLLAELYTCSETGHHCHCTKGYQNFSNDQAIELLANYGLSYWFAFAVNNHVRLGHDSVLVKGIFWLLFSKYSCMPTSEWAK